MLANKISKPIDPASLKAGFNTSDIALKNTNIGQQIITIDQTQDIQQAIDDVYNAGGGQVVLLDGTFYPKKDITMRSSIKLIGQSESATKIHFEGANYSILVAGTDVYTTGVIVAITNSVVVVGSGTSWLTNVTAGQQIFLGTRWYEIASVASDTMLILSEGYGDDLTLPTTYRIATIAKDVNFSNITITSSTAAGGVINFDDCRNVILDETQVTDSNVGISMTNCSEILNDGMFSIINTGDGVQMTNCGLVNNYNFGAISNGGYGFKLNNLKTFIFFGSASQNNSKVGMIGTKLQAGVLIFDASGNTSHGIEFASLCSNNTIGFSYLVSNGGSGVIIEGGSNNNILNGGHYIRNKAYGVNLVDSTVSNTLIISNILQQNTSGAVNDSGTGTLIRSNIGAVDN